MLPWLKHSLRVCGTILGRFVPEMDTKQLTPQSLDWDLPNQRHTWSSASILPMPSAKIVPSGMQIHIRLLFLIGETTFSKISGYTPRPILEKSAEICNKLNCGPARKAGNCLSCIRSGTVRVRQSFDRNNGLLLDQCIPSAHPCVCFSTAEGPAQTGRIAVLCFPQPGSRGTCFRRPHGGHMYPGKRKGSICL